jgi:transcriptional regulator with XRE-family HTH domain
MLFIAENLKNLRKKKDMTQEEVAEILGVSAQSVSKWERGDTFPDITLLPALANLYKTSVDSLIGMDKINDTQAKNDIFSTEHEHLRNGEYNAATAVLTEALKIFPNDEGLMSELAMALALDGDPAKLNQAIALCERVLSGHQSEKVHHTTRAALSFIYLKIGEIEKGIAVAKNLPHVRESRETILAEFKKEPSVNDINAYLRFIALGENDEQDIITVDFGIEMVAAVLDYDLRGKIDALRNEIGYNKLPPIRIRDNCSLSPNQVRVRHYADYLLDASYTDYMDVIDEIIKVLRKIAQG